ncbi:MAG: fructose-1,6-bisphosphatase [Chloroflexi bacterium]|nr:fructose-1,6-bisphosphatase [Chloroflexota bacterium]
MSISTERWSISEFMESTWSGDAELEGLDAVIRAIADGTRRVHDLVQAAALADVLGTTGETNVQGETVQKLDVAGSDIFVEVLSKSGWVAAVVSEEVEDPVVSGDSAEQNFIVYTDPVDGSSNIDVAVTIGSIFGIWRKDPGGTISETLLRPDREQVAAAYVVYGSSTVLVTATRGGVNGFTLDTGSSEFILTHPDIRFPEKCQYYSVNEGNFRKLDGPTQRAVTRLRDSLSLRYVGSLVADFHRNLLKGGIFLYPGELERPNGKLRLMYEANPLGFVAEQAGGAAYSATQPILDIHPENPHQRTPLILGNKAEVEQTVAIMQGG